MQDKAFYAQNCTISLEIYQICLIFLTTSACSKVCARKKLCCCWFSVLVKKFFLCFLQLNDSQKILCPLRKLDVKKMAICQIRGEKILEILSIFLRQNVQKKIENSKFQGNLAILLSQSVFFCSIEIPNENLIMSNLKSFFHVRVGFCLKKIIYLNLLLNSGTYWLKYRLRQ